MNKAELDRNAVLTESAVVDLNVTPNLPYEDSSFDFITNAVRITPGVTSKRSVQPNQ
jgi:hypothetical protein